MHPMPDAWVERKGPISRCRTARPKRVNAEAARRWGPRSPAGPPPRPGAQRLWGLNYELPGDWSFLAPLIAAIANQAFVNQAFTSSLTSRLDAATARRAGKAPAIEPIIPAPIPES